MKKIFTSIFLFCASLAMPAVAQNGFQYQATLQNTDGTAIADKAIAVRFSIINNDGNTVYSERHDTETDKSGLINLIIGNGDAENGSFSLIDWKKGNLSLQTEIDKGNGFEIIGKQKLGSTPYALSAGEAGGLATSDWRLTVNDNGELATEKVTTNIIPIPDGYSKLVFNDEFNGEGLVDEAKWSYEEGYVRNGELQYYTVARKENCNMSNGTLKIVAIKDNAVINGETHEITSASIHTKNKAKWTYCRVDVRAKLPVCLGSWPAIWLMPNDDVYGYWPNSGEIDIMEAVGYDPNKVYFTAHCANQNGSNNKYHYNMYLPSVSTEFHTYSLVWTNEKLSWLVDDKVRFTIKKPSNNWRDWPYTKDFYLILNLAFGGGWGGQQGVDKEALPITYEIDYVRIYQ